MADVITELAGKCGISPEMAKKGLGTLLAAAGVETVLELAQRRPDHLHQKMVETNEAKRLVRVVPGPEQVSEWVKQAQKLPRVVSY